LIGSIPDLLKYSSLVIVSGDRFHFPFFLVALLFRRAVAFQSESGSDRDANHPLSLLCKNDRVLSLV
jgi:hypothetical protein